MTILVVMAEPDKLSNYNITIYFYSYDFAEKRLNYLKKRRNAVNVHHLGPRSLMYVVKKGKKSREI